MSQPAEFAVAEEAARAAGEVLARYYREGVTMRSKDIANLVSDADLEAERAIVAVIRRAFPDHAVLGEEEHHAATDAPHLWVVDPLDGTNNFAHKIPHVAVSVAYVRDGRSECGVIYQPAPRRLVHRHSGSRGLLQRSGGAASPSPRSSTRCSSASASTTTAAR